MQTVMVFRAEESGPVAPPSVPLWRAAVAATRWQRLVGLLGRRHLPPGQGLLLVPCRAVHTIGMRFPIDVIFLAREGRVVGIATLPPGRLAWGGFHAWAALEVPAGEAQAAGLRVGERLVLRAEDARAEPS